MKRAAAWLQFFAVLGAGTLIPLALPCFASQDGVRILESDGYGVTLEIRIPEFQLEQVRFQGNTYHRIDVPGWASTSEPGMPQLPQTGVLLQVPAAGHVDVRIQESESNWRGGISILPVPAVALRPEGGELPSQEPLSSSLRLDRPERNGAVYDADALYPVNRVELEHRAVFRGVPVQRLMVYPFQWNPASGRLRCSGRIRIRVSFEKALPPDSGKSLSSSVWSEGHGMGHDPFEEILSATVRNYRAGSAIVSSTVPGRMDSSSVMEQWESGSQPCVRLEVQESGICRIYLWDLVGAGLDMDSLQADNFRMLNRGNEVALKVFSAEVGAHHLWDYLEFYAEAVDNRFTGTNVYWLHWGEGSGKRVQALDGHVTGGGQRVQSSPYTIHAEENHKLWMAAPGAPDEDYAFWELIVAPTTKEYAFTLESLAPDPPAAKLRVMLKGYTSLPEDPDHHTLISFNGTRVGEEDGWQWDGGEASLQVAEVPAVLLQEGENANTVQIEMPGDTGGPYDGIYLNWIEIEYEKQLRAGNDSAQFILTGEGLRQIEVNGLLDPVVRIYDITDPLGVEELTGFSLEPLDEGYRVIFEESRDGTRSYLVVGREAIRRLKGLALYESEGLKSPANGADYIMISPEVFAEELEPLEQLHAGRGLRVRIASVEAIYDEFSYGLIDPEAIRLFLQYAYGNWEAPAPAYVLLAGDANYDYRDYYGHGKKSWVPTCLTKTAVMGLTPTDNALVCLQGDDILPEMMVGRISAGSAEELEATVLKLAHFGAQQGPSPKAALFAADGTEEEFVAVSEELIALLPEGVREEKVYQGEGAHELPADANQGLLDAIENGVMIVNFVGHAGLQKWTNSTPPLLQVSDIALLGDQAWLPLVIALTCLNGHFALPNAYSLCEELLVDPEQGSVASLCPSALGRTVDHRILGEELFHRILVQGEFCLGKVALESKIAAHSRGYGGEHGYILQTYTLLGDPGMSLKPWQ